MGFRCWMMSQTEIEAVESRGAVYKYVMEAFKARRKHWQNII